MQQPPTPDHMSNVEISQIDYDDYSKFFDQGRNLDELQRGLIDISRSSYIKGKFVCAQFAREAFLLIKRSFGDEFEVKWFKVSSSKGTEEFSHAMVFVKRKSDCTILLIEPQSPSGQAFLIKGTGDEVRIEDEAIVSAINMHLANIVGAPTRLTDPTLTFGEVA